MYQNKVCVITGGALGIGKCLTREFSKAGAKIAFTTFRSVIIYVTTKNS